MTTDTEIAGNYAMSGGSGDPSFVAERLSEIQEEQTPDVGRVEAAELREHVETGEADYGTVDINGDSIDIVSPIGVGRRCRIAKQANTADERGDNAAGVDAILGMIDALNDSTEEAYGRDYWDDLGDEALRDAFRQAGRQSAGGAQAGN